MEHYKTVFLESNMDTCFCLNFSPSDTVSDLKKQILVEHPKCFPEVGDIKIHAVKVKQEGKLFHLPDSLYLQRVVSSEPDLYIDLSPLKKLHDHDKEVNTKKVVVDPITRSQDGDFSSFKLPGSLLKESQVFAKPSSTTQTTQSHSDGKYKTPIFTDDNSSQSGFDSDSENDDASMEEVSDSSEGEEDGGRNVVSDSSEGEGDGGRNVVADSSEGEEDGGSSVPKKMKLNTVIRSSRMYKRISATQPHPENSESKPL